MKRNQAFAAIAAVGLVLGLAACGGGNGDQDDKDDVAAADSGTVTWWGWTPDTPVAEKYIEKFNEEYPDIKVTYKNYENVDYRNAITPALESGSGPDVYNISAGGGSADAWGGFALDQSKLAEEALGADWRSLFTEGYVEQLTTSDGIMAAVPLGGMAAGFVWYNDNIFAEAGATPPTDYDSWVDACAKIQAVGKICFTVGLGGQDTFPTEMFHSVANSVDPDWFLKATTGRAQWTDPQGVEVMEIFQRMAEDGIISKNALDGPQYPLANEEFMRGEAAMVQMGYWYAQYSGLESAKTAMESAGVSNPEPFVQLPLNFPDVAQKGNGSALFGDVDYGLAINAESKNIAASKTFVKWMTMSQVGQQTVASAIDVIPAVKGVTPDWDTLVLVDQAKQQPALTQLLDESTSTTQTRQWQATDTTLRAIVVAIQELVDPTVNKTIPDILQTLQDTSEPSDMGL
ncbi:MAG: ABC transporter substrate-binding protein [Bifidobacteriaceae bacterium]|nr:ABC transporter substrate-binding protein [Bifidobacteriaceae bacterium]